jgi:hypothetical protein
MADDIDFADERRRRIAESLGQRDIAGLTNTQLYLNEDRNPDEAAEDLSMAERLGVPSLVARENRESFRDDEELTRLNSFVSENPEMQEWLADPDNFSVVRDDTDALGTIIREFRGLGKGIAGIIQAQVHGWQEQYYGLAQKQYEAPMVQYMAYNRLPIMQANYFADQPKREITPEQRTQLDAIDAEYEKARAALKEGDWEGILDLGLKRDAQVQAVISPGEKMPSSGDLGLPDLPALAARANENRQKARAQVEAVLPQGRNVVERGLIGGANSMLQMAPALATSVALRNPTPAIAAAGFGTQGREYGRARDEGLEPGTAAEYATLMGAIEAGTEIIPDAGLIKELAKRSPVGKMLIRQYLREMTSEQLATVSQDFVEWQYINPEKTLEEYIAERPEAFIETAIASGVQTAGSVSVGKITQTAAEGLEKRARRLGMNDYEKTLDKMLDAAEKSKLKKRSEKRFKSAVERIVEREDDPAREIVIDLDGVSEAFGEDSEALNQLLEFYETSGGDVDALIRDGEELGEVRISTADMLSNPKLSDVREKLQPHMRFTEQEYTPYQRQMAIEAFQGVADSIAGAAMQEVDRTAERENAYQALTDKMMEDFTAIGALPNDEQTLRSAQVLASMVEVAANEVGVDPIEFYKSGDGFASVQRVFGDVVVRPDDAQGVDIRAADILLQARSNGYEGSDAGEGAEWLAATRKGLDMSQEARMSRKDAWQDELDTPDDVREVRLFHGTGSDIKEFELSGNDIDSQLGPGVFLTKYSEISGVYADAKKNGTNPNIVPVVIRGNIVDRGSILLPPPILLLRRAKSQFPDMDDADAVRAWFKSQGIDGLRSENWEEVTVFDPANIRSTAAAFDPDNAGSANILAQRIFDPAPIVSSYKTEAQREFLGKFEELREELIASVKDAIKSRDAYYEELPARVKEEADKKKLESASRAKGLVEEYDGYIRDEVESLTSDYNDSVASIREEAASDPNIDLEAELKDLKDELDKSIAEIKASYKADLNAELKDSLMEDIEDILQERIEEAYEGELENIQNTYDEKYSELEEDIETRFEGVELYEDQVIKDHLSNREVNTTEVENALKKGSTLDQSMRGQYSPAQNTITLFESSDISTLMHEASHWYLDLLERMADSVPAFRKQLDAVYNWHGVSDTFQTYDENGRVTPEGVELHESFAESFEVYLKEGKAPSSRLRDAFRAFKSWLVRLYQRIGLPVRAKLNPEIRDVFDRMLATDSEVNAVTLEQHTEATKMAKAMFDKGILTERQYKNALKRLGAAREEAKERLLSRLMQDRMREEKSWWDSERKRIRGDVMREFDTSLVGRAMNWLGEGVWKGDRPDKDDDAGNEAFYQDGSDGKNLFLAHNTSAEKLKKSLALGGFPMPSLAVARVDKGGFSNFGEITFLGKPELLNERDITAYSADIYSPTVPEALPIVNDKAVKAFIEEAMQSVPENANVRSYLSIDYSSRDLARELQNDELVVVKFLADEGRLPKLKRLKVDKEVKAALKTEWDSPERKALAEAYYRRKEDEFNAKREEHGRKRISLHFDEETGELSRRDFDAFDEKVREASQSPYDQKQFSRDLNKRVRSSNAARGRFNKYTSDLAERFTEGLQMFEGFTPSGNRKYKPFNLENIMKRMRKEMREGEGDGFSNVGTIRARRASKPMNKLKDFKANRELISDAETTEEMKQRFNDRYFELVDELMPFYKYSQSNRFMVLDTVADVIAGSRRDWADAFDPEAFPKIEAFIDELRTLPTDYFEAKANRVMQPQDFEAVVVPRDIDPDLKEELKRRGLKLRFYKSGDDADRLRAIQGQSDVLFQSAPTYFSALKQFVDNAQQPKAPATQWKAIISKAPGIKAEEIEWTGLNDWLDAQESSVTREAVSEYLANNGVEIEEVAKADVSAASLEAQQRMQEIERELLPKIERRDKLRYEIMGAKGEEKASLEAESSQLFDDILKLKSEFDELSVTSKYVDGTQYSTWTLSGGKDYTELLLKIPNPGDKLNARRMEIEDKARTGDATDADKQEWADIMNALQPDNRDIEGVQRFKNFPDYRSPHWSEPNVLAHTRFKTRTGPNGERILALEEIQSDWHQAGRNRGYKGDGVPNAPFKNNAWVNLVLKRMIRYAAENDYDELAWIPGDIQNGQRVDAEDGRSDFYDKIVPNAANKLGKKYGAKVGSIELPDAGPDGSAIEIYSLPITPELKAAALETGFPLFQKSKDPAGWGDVPPPSDLPSMRLDLNEIRRTRGDKAVKALPLSVRRRSMAGTSIDGLMETVRTVKEILKQKPPRNLLEEIVRLGGFPDYGGDIIKALGKKALYPGLIKGKPGAPREEQGFVSASKSVNTEKMNDDDKARRALQTGDRDLFVQILQARGFLPETEERITENELVDIIVGQIKGAEPIYSQNEDAQSQLKDIEQAEEWRQWFDQNGVDIFAKKAELEKSLKNVMAELDDTISAEDAADILGFESGDALIAALIAAGSRESFVNKETKRRMTEEFGDVLEDGTLEAEARKAAENDLKYYQNELELEALQKAIGKQPAAKAAKDMARQRIAMMSVRELRKYKRFLQQERRWAEAAADAIRKDDIVNAALFQQRRLIASQMYTEGEKAFERTQKIHKNLREWQTISSRREKIANDWMEKIDGILDRYELRKAEQGQKRIEKKLSAREYVTMMTDEGREAELAPEVILLADQANDKPFESLTVEQVEYLSDTIANMAHLGKLKQQLLTKQDKRAFDTIITEMVDHLDGVKSDVRFRSATPSIGEKVVDRFRKIDAYLTKLEHQFRALDGKENGPIWRQLFRPLTQAADVESQMMREAGDKLDALFDMYSFMERQSSWMRRVETPETPPNGKKFTKMDIISIALNWGNEGNRQAIVDGFGWRPEDVQVMLERVMTDKDWDFVEGMWELIGSFRDDAFQLQKDITGAAPEAVEAEPFTLRSGRKIKGGYYPLKYDGQQPNALSVRQMRLDEKQALQELGASFTRPMTRKGHLIERVGSGGKPVQLDISVGVAHIQNVVHDIAYRRAILDIHRIIRDKRFTEAYINAAGRDQYNKLTPWLTQVASDQMESGGILTKIFSGLRKNFSIVVMGYKMGTALQQLSGVVGAVPMIGYSYSARGFARAFAGGPASFWSSWKKVAEMSEFMRSRPQSMERDIRAVMQRYEARSPLKSIHRFAFMLIGIMDGAVSTSVWMGAYDKAMDGNAKGIEPGDTAAAILFADSVVRRSQSAGLIQDLPEIMRGNEFEKQLTMVYSYFSNLYNMTRSQVLDVRRGNIGFTEFMGNMSILYVIIPMMAMMLAGRFPPEEEEEIPSLLAAEVLSNAFGTLPVARDIANAALRPQFGYDMSPSAGGLERIITGARRLPEAAQGEEKAIKAGIYGAGYLFGLPAAQMWITGEFVYDVATGQEDISENPADSLREALLRDTR